MLNEIEKIKQDIFNVARVTWGKTTRQLAHDAGYKLTQKVDTAILSLALEGKLIPEKNDKGEILVKRITPNKLKKLLTK